MSGKLTHEQNAAAQRRHVARRLATDPDAFRAYRYECNRRWREKNREKVRAHLAVARAIRAGRLVRPEICGRCGEARKIEASHDDYSRPLDVEWLCRQCHALKDRRAN